MGKDAHRPRLPPPSGAEKPRAPRPGEDPRGFPRKKPRTGPILSRGPRGTPRQEQPRKPAEPEESPPPAASARTLWDELRQWGLCRTFVHQFRLIAQRVIPPSTGEKRPKGKRDFARRLWARFRRDPKPKPGLAAVKHAQLHEAQEPVPVEEPFRPVNQTVGNHVRSLFRFLLS